MCLSIMSIPVCIERAEGLANGPEIPQNWSPRACDVVCCLDISEQAVNFWAAGTRDYGNISEYSAPVILITWATMRMNLTIGSSYVPYICIYQLRILFYFSAVSFAQCSVPHPASKPIVASAAFTHMLSNPSTVLHVFAARFAPNMTKKCRAIHHH